MVGRRSITVNKVIGLPVYEPVGLVWAAFSSNKSCYCVVVVVVAGMEGGEGAYLGKQGGHLGDSQTDLL